jgi:very-short-patch-repair endonuclease
MGAIILTELERKMSIHIAALGLKCEREYRFHPERRWRFDFAWPDKKVALEVEGGTWSNGAHTRGKHFESDCEKYNEAAIAGWHVIRVTTDMVRDGRAIGFLLRALGIEQE